MQRTKILLVGAVLGTVASAVAVAGAMGAFSGQRTSGELAPLPSVPWTERVELVEVVPFTLARPAIHEWRAERPTYDQGYLVVLRAHPDVLIRRQGPELVLYAGAETVERVNGGERSGHLVGIVPGPIDLAAAPFHFGEAALPEAITRDEAQRQLARARSMGARDPGAARIAALTAPTVELSDSYEIQLIAADLVEKHSPDERDLVRGLRAPLVR
jgi:hypothetical protein